jgi:hypothetical protein
MCADCNSKTPRWASITFGTFVCLRCSGQHRNFGVHISKIKSVNLDKWPPGKVQVFQALSNDLVNSYWEANLPPNYSKPGPSAANHEVVRYMTDKYINKKWIDTKMKYDPLFLFENKREKFDRWLRKRMGGAPEPKPAVVQTQPLKQAQVIKPATPVMPVMDDLINFGPAADTFNDFQQATPAPTNYDSLLSLYNAP